jgi:hypothetical protein
VVKSSTDLTSTNSIFSSTQATDPLPAPSATKPLPPSLTTKYEKFNLDEIFYFATSNSFVRRMQWCTRCRPLILPATFATRLIAGKIRSTHISRNIRQIKQRSLSVTFVMGSLKQSFVLAPISRFIRTSDLSHVYSAIKGDNLTRI